MDPKGLGSSSHCRPCRKKEGSGPLSSETPPVGSSSSSSSSSSILPLLRSFAASKCGNPQGRPPLRHLRCPCDEDGRRRSKRRKGTPGGIEATQSRER